MHEPYRTLTLTALEAVRALEDVHARDVDPGRVRDRVERAHAALDRLEAEAARDMRQGYRFLWERTLVELRERLLVAETGLRSRMRPSPISSSALSDAS